MSKITENKNKNFQQMLIIMVFNIVCHHFFRWDLFIDRAPAFSRHTLQAHLRMLRICVNGSNVWVLY